jgi:ATP-binding cassette subfamily B protein
MSSVLVRLAAIFKPFRGTLLAITGLTAAKGFVDLAAPYLLGQIVNQIGRRGPWQTSLELIALSFCAYAAALGLTSARELYSLMRFDYDAPLALGRKMLTKLSALSVGQNRQQHSGIVHTTILKGEQAIHSLAYVVMSDLAPLVLHVIPTLGALIWAFGGLGLLVTCGVALYSAAAVAIGKRFQEPLSSVRDLGAVHSKLQSELLRNMSVIQLNAQQARAEEELLTSGQEHGAVAKMTWRKFIAYDSLNLGQLVLLRCLALLAAAYAAHENQHSAGSLVVFVLWTQTAISGLSRVSPIQRRIASLWPDLMSYLGVLDLVPNVKSPAHPVRPYRYSGAIELQNVSFAYPPAEPAADSQPDAGRRPAGSEAIRNLSLRIAPGERVGFVGLSGAGKSTLVALLLRAYDPDSGRILIDGHDLRHLDLDDYRRNVGVVEQGVLLFDKSIRYNVLFGIRNELPVSEEELHRALNDARVTDFAHRLPEGLETRVGERGVSLSGGEGQRVSIARALVKRPSILVLDEATSHLDAMNEATIMDSLQGIAERRTTIVIAHRISAVSKLDRIFVLDRGTLVSVGSHDDLLARCGIYRGLAARQSTAALMEGAFG